jgi:hypothetical protein
MFLEKKKQILVKFCNKKSKSPKGKQLVLPCLCLHFNLVIFFGLPNSYNKQLDFQEQNISEIKNLHPV